MNAKHKLFAVAVGSGFTMSGHAFAADNNTPANPERSFVMDAPPPERSKAEIRAELDAFRHNPVTPDGWRDVGGERGDAFVQPRYAFVDGKLTRVDNGVRDAPKPSTALTPEEMKIASIYYKAAM